jgi:DNA-binding beta-propeller fold protein YncE
VWYQRCAAPFSRPIDSHPPRQRGLKRLHCGDDPARHSDAAQFFGPSAVDVDPQNGDVYVADGHGGGNTRIAVLDKNGTFLRQFRLHHTEAEKNIEVLPHCMRLSTDGLVYVCDRQANRLQAFDKMGNFKSRNHDLGQANAGDIVSIRVGLRNKR